MFSRVSEFNRPCRRSFFIAYDQTDAGLRDQKAILDILLSSSTSDGTLASLAQRFQTHAAHVLERDSYFLAGKTVKNVDVSGVLKLVPVHWVCEELAGIELKRDASGSEGHGEWTDEQLFRMLGELYECVTPLLFPLLKASNVDTPRHSFIFLDEDPENQLENEQRARSHAEVITRSIKASLRSVNGNRVSIIGKIGSLLSNGHAKKASSHEFLSKMVATGRPHDELANAILSIMIVTAVELSQCKLQFTSMVFIGGLPSAVAMINMVNLYLDSPMRNQIADASTETLQAFAREAIRLDPPFAGVFRTSHSYLPTASAYS